MILMSRVYACRIRYSNTPRKEFFIYSIISWQPNSQFGEEYEMPQHQRGRE